MRTFTIPGKPVGKGRPRFTRSGRAYTPKSTKDYEKAVKRAYMAKYGDVEPYEGDIPLMVYIIAYFQIPKNDSKSTKEKKLKGEIPPTIKVDIDNICKIILDGAQGVAFHDDKQIVCIAAEKRYSDNPRVEVVIREYEKFQAQSLSKMRY